MSNWFRYEFRSKLSALNFFQIETWLLLCREIKPLHEDEFLQVFDSASTQEKNISTDSWQDDPEAPHDLQGWGL